MQDRVQQDLMKREWNRKRLEDEVKHKDESEQIIRDKLMKE